MAVGAARLPSGDGSRRVSLVTIDHDFPSPAARSVLIVIDGGASRCRAAAFDEHGVRRTEVVIEAHASLSLGVEAAASTVARAVRAIADRLDRADGWAPAGMVLGLAGSLGVARRQALVARLRADGCAANGRIEVITDGQAQLLGATGGRAGACVAVGTGSVLYWLDEDGEIGSAGGWGFPAGDEGSGAWLGSRLLGAYLRHRDAGTPTAPVFAALERCIGRDASSVQRWATTTRPTEIAGLVPLIRAAAEDGDELASALFDAGASECARLLELAPSHLPIHLVGGLAVIYEIGRASCRERV